MSFTEFDLTDYIDALEQFKNENAREVIKHWGSIETFDQMIEKLKEDESGAAQLAVKQFGSIEKYTEVMKNNMEHFSELMERADALAEKKDELLRQNRALFVKLTSDLTRDPASEEVQSIIREIMDFSRENDLGVDLGQGYWDMVIESYSHDTVKKITDNLYGPGASVYIAETLRVYFRKYNTRR